MECNIINMFVSVCLYWLFGGFQINSRANHDDAVHSEVYSETSDGQSSELTRIYRAENDVDLKEFVTDVRTIKMERIAAAACLHGSVAFDLGPGSRRPEKTGHVSCNGSFSTHRLSPSEPGLHE